MVEGVVRGIEKEVERVEADLEAVGSEDMSEEVRGIVLAAIGKARLLISQKIQQFQGLCHKNIVSLFPITFVLFTCSHTVYYTECSCRSTKLMFIRYF